MHLPPDSALARSQQEHPGWNLQTYLAAATEHAVRVLAWQNSWPSKKADQAKHMKAYPQPVKPVPDEPEPAPPRLTLVAMDEFKRRTEGGGSHRS